MNKLLVRYRQVKCLNNVSCFKCGHCKGNSILNYLSNNINTKSAVDPISYNVCDILLKRENCALNTHPRRSMRLINKRQKQEKK